MRKPLESACECRVVAWVRKHRMEAVKLQKRKGWPDYLFLMRYNYAVFAEFKRTGEEPDKFQKHVHCMLRSMGFDVLVIDNYLQGVTVLERYL